MTDKNSKAKISAQSNVLLGEKVNQSVPCFGKSNFRNFKNPVFS